MWRKLFSFVGVGVFIHIMGIEAEKNTFIAVFRGYLRKITLISRKKSLGT